MGSTFSPFQCRGEGHSSVRTAREGISLQGKALRSDPETSSPLKASARKQESDIITFHEERKLAQDGVSWSPARPGT